MKHNEGYCFNCGNHTEDYESIGNTTLWVCSKRECQKELRFEIESYLSEEREKRDLDNYSNDKYSSWW